ASAIVIEQQREAVARRLLSIEPGDQARDQPAGDEQQELAGGCRYRQRNAGVVLCRWHMAWARIGGLATRQRQRLQPGLGLTARQTFARQAARLSQRAQTDAGEQ